MAGAYITMNETIIDTIFQHHADAFTTLSEVLQKTIKTAMRSAYRAGVDDSQPLLPLGFASEKQVPPMSEAELSDFMDSLGCKSKQQAEADRAAYLKRVAELQTHGAVVA